LSSGPDLLGFIPNIIQSDLITNSTAFDGTFTVVNSIISLSWILSTYLAADFNIGNACAKSAYH